MLPTFLVNFTAIIYQVTTFNVNLSHIPINDHNYECQALQALVKWSVFNFIQIAEQVIEAFYFTLAPIFVLSNIETTF